jgi:hypothetical protein
MKDCIYTCTIFYIIFLTYLFVFGFTLIYSGDLKALENVLDNEQKDKYDKIKKERLHHFYSGLGVGGILGLFVLLTDFKATSKYCLAGIVLLMTTSCVYYILPKSDYMIKHLKTEEQRTKWLNVSRNFVKKKICSFLLVIVLYFCVPLFNN